MADETTPTPTPEQESEVKQTPPDINLRDINAVVQIIDTAARRGAFEGKEFQTIGSVRDRFAEFLQFHLPKEEQADTGSEPKTEES